MKNIFLAPLFVVLILLSVNANGQTGEKKGVKTDAHLTGHVVDAQTNEHLSYVTILIKGARVESLSDASGHFLIKDLPLGKHNIQLSMMGYKPLEQQVEILADRTVEVHLKMEPSATQIDQVVVTGSRNETKKSESSTIVNVISSKLFNKTASNNVAEVLNFQPGLRVEYNCSNCGVPQLRINGLEGSYSQILLDSRPIFSSLATVYGLEQLPTGMIERVEVIRGGGSTLFGSNAIGGVVNIITKEPQRSSASLSNYSAFYGGADISTTLNASLVSDDYRTGLYMFAMVKDRDSYDRNGDGFSEIPTLNSQTIGFRAYHRFNSNSRLTAEYHHISEFRRGGNMFDRPPHEADIAEQLRHKINGGGLKYDLWSPDNRHRVSVYGSIQYIDRDSYFGTAQNLDSYGKTDDLTLVGGAQYSISFARLLFMPSQLTLGVEYQNNNLRDNMLGINRVIDQYSLTYGGYLQNEWKNKQWGLLVGARVDKHNKVRNVIISPRANFRYTPSDKVALRLSYSSGYRAPQAYEEDLHVAAVGGKVSIITLDPNLRPEYSKSVSGSVDLYQNFGSVEVNLLIEGFYTKLDDVFTLLEYGRDEQGNLLLERRNAPGATVSGVNLELKTGFTRNLTLDAGFTYQKSLYDEPLKWSDNEQIALQKKMFRSPDMYGYGSINYTPINPLSLSLNAVYTGSMDVQHMAGYVDKDEVVSTPSFWDMGFRASYDFQLNENLGLELSAGVKNIFDSFQRDLDIGMNKDAGYIYGPVFPRTVFVGIKLKLNGKS